MELLLSIPHESRVCGPTNRLNDVPSEADATIEASPVNMTLFYFRQLADKQHSARLVRICINLLTPTFAIKNSMHPDHSLLVLFSKYIYSIYLHSTTEIYGNS